MTKAFSDSIISNWRLSDLLDSVGSNTLTGSGTPTFTTGRFSNAMSLVRASSQYATINTNSTFDVNGGSFWISAWVRMTSLNAFMYVACQDAASGTTNRLWYLMYVQSVNAFRFQCFQADGTALSSSATSTNAGVAAISTWYHLLGWHDATKKQVGIACNGVENISSYTITTMGNSSALPFRIGSVGSASNHWFDGLVDDVTFGKGYAPRRQERYQLYKRGKPMPFPKGSPGSGLLVGVA